MPRRRDPFQKSLNPRTAPCLIAADASLTQIAEIARLLFMLKPKACVESVI
jgi:hypothetical protein